MSDLRLGHCAATESLIGIFVKVVGLSITKETAGNLHKRQVRKSYKYKSASDKHFPQVRETFIRNIAGQQVSYRHF